MVSRDDAIVPIAHVLALLASCLTQLVSWNCTPRNHGCRGEVTPRTREKLYYRFKFSSVLCYDYEYHDYHANIQYRTIMIDSTGILVIPTTTYCV